jgi:hypothetical protein
MEGIEIILIFPFVGLLCATAVQLLRKHWHNALTVFLASAVCFLLMFLIAQSHQRAITYAILRMQRSKIEQLKSENRNIGTSNQTHETIGAENAP